MCFADQIWMLWHPRGLITFLGRLGKRCIIFNYAYISNFPSKSNYADGSQTFHRHGFRNLLMEWKHTVTCERDVQLSGAQQIVPGWHVICWAQAAMAGEDLFLCFPVSIYSWKQYMAAVWALHLNRELMARYFVSWHCETLKQLPS